MQHTNFEGGGKIPPLALCRKNPGVCTGVCTIILYNIYLPQVVLFDNTAMFIRHNDLLFPGRREGERERKKGGGAGINFPHACTSYVHVHVHDVHVHVAIIIIKYFLLDFVVDCVEEFRREVLSIVSLSLIPNKLLQARIQNIVR
jgi:hypothetical protein